MDQVIRSVELFRGRTNQVRGQIRGLILSCQDRLVFPGQVPPPGCRALWLRPGDWPETFTGQTRRVVTVTLFAITAATGLVLRTVAPSATLTADLRHPATSLWLVPLLL